MRELDFQKAFNKWMKFEFPMKKDGIDGFYSTMVFELKVVHGKKMKFSQVEEHQVEALYNSAHNGFYYKIWDIQGTRNRQLMKKPFDCFIVQNCQAYLVIIFDDDDPGFMYWIDIESWVSIYNFHKNVMKEKSISIELIKKQSLYNFKIEV